MSKNLSTLDRSARVVASLAMIVGSVVAPLGSRLWSFGLALGGIYLLGTALAGTCLGYKLMGLSSCPVSKNNEGRV